MRRKTKKLIRGGNYKKLDFICTVQTFFALVDSAESQNTAAAALAAAASDVKLARSCRERFNNRLNQDPNKITANTTNPNERSILIKLNEVYQTIKGNKTSTIFQDIYTNNQDLIHHQIGKGGPIKRQFNNGSCTFNYNVFENKKTIEVKLNETVLTLNILRAKLYTEDLLYGTLTSNVDISGEMVKFFNTNFVSVSIPDGLGKCVSSIVSAKIAEEVESIAEAKAINAANAAAKAVEIEAAEVEAKAAAKIKMAEAKKNAIQRAAEAERNYEEAKAARVIANEKKVLETLYAEAVAEAAAEARLIVNKQKLKDSILKPKDTDIPPSKVQKIYNLMKLLLMKCNPNDQQPMHQSCKNIRLEEGELVSNIYIRTIGVFAFGILGSSKDECDHKNCENNCCKCTTIYKDCLKTIVNNTKVLYYIVVKSNKIDNSPFDGIVKFIGDIEDAPAYFKGLLSNFSDLSLDPLHIALFKEFLQDYESTKISSSIFEILNLKPDCYTQDVKDTKDVYQQIIVIQSPNSTNVVVEQQIYHQLNEEYEEYNLIITPEKEKQQAGGSAGFFKLLVRNKNLYVYIARKYRRVYKDGVGSYYIKNKKQIYIKKKSKSRKI